MQTFTTDLLTFSVVEGERYECSLRVPDDCAPGGYVVIDGQGSTPSAALDVAVCRALLRDLMPAKG